MTKAMLYPWLRVLSGTGATFCAPPVREAGYLTGGSFLPWMSIITESEQRLIIAEGWEQHCAGDIFPLVYTECWEGGDMVCSRGSLQTTEGWES